MPVYEYEHVGLGCEAGTVIEVRQSIEDPALDICPHCRKPVRKIMSRPNLAMPKSDRELRDLGFTKLVRRDDGVYENVTAREGDSRVMERGKPETVPNLKKTIRD